MLDGVFATPAAEAARCTALKAAGRSPAIEGRSQHRGKHARSDKATEVEEPLSEAPDPMPWEHRQRPTIQATTQVPLSVGLIGGPQGRTETRLETQPAEGIIVRSRVPLGPSQGGMGVPTGRVQAEEEVVAGPPSEPAGAEGACRLTEQMSEPRASTLSPPCCAFSW